MKLQNNNADVQVVGSSGTSTFSIEMNAKAFRVLSSTLYRNKIGSIVREVSCNALDAQKMIGYTGKFQIHLPDSFEPWFSVRDFGVGMNPEQIVNVFTKYFKSTKDESNDVIGAFGLGAKTPFSYTDQFTVVSIVDGIKYIYSAYIGKDGMPSIDLMGSDPTDEPRGVEIRISVRRDDFSAFKTEVATQLTFFKNKPEILNGSVSYKQVDPARTVLQIDNHKFWPKGAGYGMDGIFIIQGEVGYSLNVNSFKSSIANINDPEIGQLINFIDSCRSSNRIELWFDIGEIGVTASREDVEYDEGTVKRIIARLKEVRKEIAVETKAKIDNVVEGYKKNAIWFSMSSFERSLLDSDTVKGIGDSIIYVQDTSVRLHFQPRPTSNTTDRVVVRANELYDGAKSNVIFVWGDTSSLKRKRFAKLQEQYYTVYWFDFDQSLTDFDKVKKSISDTLMGYPFVMKASDVVIPKAERKSYSRGPITRCVSINIDTGRIEKISDKVSEIEDEFYYVIVDDFRGYKDNSFSNVYSALKVLPEFKEAKVLFIKEKDVSEAIDNENCLGNLKSKLKQSVQLMLNKKFKKGFLKKVLGNTYESNTRYWTRINVDRNREVLMSSSVRFRIMAELQKNDRTDDIDHYEKVLSLRGYCIEVDQMIHNEIQKVDGVSKGLSKKLTKTIGDVLDTTAGRFLDCGSLADDLVDFGVSKAIF